MAVMSSSLDSACNIDVSDIITFLWTYKETYRKLFGSRILVMNVLRTSTTLNRMILRFEAKTTLTLPVTIRATSWPSLSSLFSSLLHSKSWSRTASKLLPLMISWTCSGFMRRQERPVRWNERVDIWHGNQFVKSIIKHVNHLSATKSSISRW